MGWGGLTAAISCGGFVFFRGVGGHSRTAEESVEVHFGLEPVGGESDGELSCFARDRFEEESGAERWTEGVEVEFVIRVGNADLQTGIKRQMQAAFPVGTSLI